MPQGTWGRPRLACDWRQHGSAPHLLTAIDARARPRLLPLATLDQAGLGEGIQSEGGRLLGPSEAQGLRAPAQSVALRTTGVRMRGPHNLKRALHRALLQVPLQACDGRCVAGVTNREGAARVSRGRWWTVPSSGA